MAVRQTVARLPRPGLAAGRVPGRSRPRAIRMAVVACLAVIVVPGLLNGPDLLTFNLACTYAVAAIGLSLIFGLGGFVSVAQAAIMAVGGYTLILLFGDTTGLVVGLVLATLAGAVVSAFTGVIGARVHSHYFILVSLAIAEVVTLVITNATSLTGGANGTPLKGAATLLGLQLAKPEDYLILIVALVAVSAYIADSLRSSRGGLALRARIVDEYLSLAAGISIGRYRILVTAVGGAMAGLAGGMLAILDAYLGPQNFDLATAILLLLMVVVAGTGRSGSVVASALALTFLSQGLLTLTATGKLIYGIGLIALIIFAPDSLGGLTRGVKKLAGRLRPGAGPPAARDEVER